MTKNKTLTLDELLDKLKRDSQESEPYSAWQKSLDKTFDEARQQFLQWVADEVVGRKNQDETDALIDWQLRQLKAAGWKPEGEK